MLRRPNNLSYRNVILSEAAVGGLPVGYWPLDESGGVTAVDQMTIARGAGSNGTYNSNSGGAWTGGTLNTKPSLVNRDATGAGAASFNGSSGYVDIPEIAAHDFTAGITLEAWIKPASVTGFQQIFGKNVSTSSPSGRVWGLFLSGTALGIEVRSSAGIPAYTNEAGLTIGGKFHVVGTWDGSNLRTYANGALLGTPQALGGSIVSQTCNIQIGAFVSSFSLFNGVIQHPLVYNYALGADRINFHYLAGLNGAFGGK